MILWIFTFILSLVVLLGSAKVFVEKAEKLVKSMGWSSFLVGVTVLAIGTSLPELTTSLWAAHSDTSSLIASNVVGSNIANILLILGLGALMTKKIQLEKDTLHSQIGLLLGSTFLLLITLTDGRFEWTEGLVMIAVYLVYSFYNAEEHKSGRLETLKNWLLKVKMEPKEFFVLFLSAVVLGGASFMVVKSLEGIANTTNVLPSLLGASLLAVGTSLPELVTTLMALKKNDSQMALGNIIGSNIFNATLVMGLPSLLGPLTVSNDVLVLGIPFLLMATFLLIFALVQRKLARYEGAIYLILYLLFSFKLFASF